MDNFEERNLGFDNDDFELLEREIDEIDKLEQIRVDVSEGLESAFSELEQLKNEVGETTGDNLLVSIKETVLGTITSQFGIGFLVHKDGGNVTTAPNFEKGITSTEEDAEHYQTYKENNDGSKKWNDVRKDAGYDTSFPQKRKEAFQNNETIIDDYTGKNLPKDGSTHLDHVVPVKEIESNAKNNLLLSPEQRVAMATNDTNLAWTEAPINQSKGEKDMGEFISDDNIDKKTGETKVNKYGINKEMAMEKDKEARKDMQKTVNVAAAKKYSKELLVTGAKDAGKMAAYSAIGIVVRDFTQGVFITIKEVFANRKGKSLRELFHEFYEKMKNVMKNILSKWKDILKGSFEAGITAFFSNLLVFVINLFFTTLKKLVVMIRAGFTSLVQGVKMIANPPQGMTKEEARYQGSKIMIAGVIGGVSIGLSAAVEKLLQAIPGLQPVMMFPIPIENRTVSDVIAVTLSSVLGGILTTIVLHLMDSARKENKIANLQIQMVAKSGEIVQYKIAQSWFALHDAYKFLEGETKDMVQFMDESNNRMEASLSRVQDASQKYADLVNKL